MRMRVRLSFWALLLIAAAPGPAAVKLPRVISDHMMLQRDMPVRIWGQADPGEQVTVSFHGQRVSTRAGAGGRWEVFLAPLAAGGPYELTVSGENTVSVRDVLVGDVWVASGQSNMVWPVERSDDAEKEIATADYPRIRLFKVALKTADAPLDDVEGEWTPCRPDTVKSFSAVGYFFARHLHRKLDVPVGVIQSAWGGTPAEAWTSLGALKAEPALHYFLDHWDEVLASYPAAKLRYARALKQWEAEGKPEGRRPRPPLGPGHQHAPAGLFNAMIAPLTPHAIRGVIWYQGENNAARGQGYLYRRLFQTLILDWRKQWAQGPFPFLFVQLANYARTGSGSQWPELRQAQAMALELRGTAMAVTIDIGESQDIHPKNKQDVGERLALGARHIAYGESLVYSGPLFRQLTRENNRLRVWFDHAGGGLQTRGSGPLKGFVVAGEERVFFPAEARIEGGTVVVSSSDVPAPVAVRYAWADDPENNLINAEGLPASPFRSDDWRDAQMAR